MDLPVNIEDTTGVSPKVKTRLRTATLGLCQGGNLEAKRFGEIRIEAKLGELIV